MKLSYTVKYVILFLLVMELFACRQADDRKERKVGQKEIRESLIKANKNIVKTEEQEIKDFLRRYDWEVEKTGSGLRYLIVKDGEGKKGETGRIASIAYSVQFLTGDTLEKSAKGKPLQFIIGKDDVISGLQEGILLLKEGDEAIFIIPSHLAYGFTGKPGRIPPKTTLVYYVKVLKIN